MHPQARLATIQAAPTWLTNETATRLQQPVINHPIRSAVMPGAELISAHLGEKSLVVRTFVAVPPRTTPLFRRREYNRRVTEIVQESWINTSGGGGAQGA